MKRTVVVGLGDISPLHLAALADMPDVELVGVCDIVEDRAERGQETYGVPAFTNHQELFEAVRPDVVHITTPHHQHVPVALDAIEAGIHVLTEKPVAHTMDDARRLADAARNTSTKVGVCFQNRYNPTSVHLKRLLDSGDLGDIVGARAAVWWHRSPAYYAAAPWRGRWSEGGGGVVINQAIHTLDLLQWVLGGVATSCGQASTLTLADAIEVEDTAAIVITAPSGKRGTFFATNAHHVNANVEFEVTTEGGVLQISDAHLTLLRPDGTKTMVANDVQATGARSYWGKGHSLLIEDFYSRLDDPEPFWIDPQEAMISLKVLRDTYVQSGLIPRA